MTQAVRSKGPSILDEKMVFLTMKTDPTRSSHPIGSFWETKLQQSNFNFPVSWMEIWRCLAISHDGQTLSGTEPGDQKGGCGWKVCRCPLNHRNVFVAAFWGVHRFVPYDSNMVTYIIENYIVI